MNVNQKKKNMKQQSTVYRDLGQFHEWRGSAVAEQGQRAGQNQVRDAIAKYRERREAAIHLFGRQGQRHEDNLANSEKRLKRDNLVVTSNSTSERIRKLQMATLAPITAAVSQVSSTSDRKVPSSSDIGTTSKNLKTVTKTTATTISAEVSNKSENTDLNAKTLTPPTVRRPREVSSKSDRVITSLNAKTQTPLTATTTVVTSTNTEYIIKKTPSRTTVNGKVMKELASSANHLQSSTTTQAANQDSSVFPYGYVPWSSKPEVSYVPWSANKTTTSSTSSVVSESLDLGHPERDITPEIEPVSISKPPSGASEVVKDIDRVDRVFRHLEQEDWGQKPVRHDRHREEEIGIGVEKSAHKENFGILGRDRVTSDMYTPPPVVVVDEPTENDHLERVTANQYTKESDDHYTDRSISNPSRETITQEMEYDDFPQHANHYERNSRTDHSRRFRNYLAAKKKSRIHRRDDVSTDRNKGHSQIGRRDSRHHGGQEHVDDRNRLEELTQLLKTFIEKSERVYPVKRLNAKQPSEENDFRRNQSYQEDVSQRKDLNHQGIDNTSETEKWQHSNRGNPFNINDNIEKLVSPGKVLYSKENEISSGQEETTEDMTEFDRLLKAELERKKRKDEIKDMLIRAGEESVTAYRERVENRPSGQGGVQNADNYPIPSRDELYRDQNETEHSDLPMSRIHPAPLANMAHDMPGPGSHMVAPIAPIAPYVVRPPLLSFPPVVVLRPGLPIVPPTFPLQLQPSALPLPPGNQTIPRLPVPSSWHSQTSSTTSDAPSSTVRSIDSNSTPVTSTRTTAETSRGNLQQNKPQKPIMTIDLTQSNSPPPSKPQPLMDVDVSPHLRRDLSTSFQQRNAPSNHSPYSAQRPAESHRNNENFVGNQRKVNPDNIQENDMPPCNTRPAAQLPIIPPAGQPQLVLYNNMLLPVQSLNMQTEQRYPTEPFDIPIQEEPPNPHEERGRHNLLVHNPRAAPSAPSLPSTQQQEQQNKPHKRTRRGRGGKVFRTPEERRQLRNEQKNASSMNAPWFDGECYLASKRKKQVIHRMRHRVALQKRQGDLINAEETMNAIKGVQNAYSNFIRGKKAMYEKDREEKGDIEYICKLTLENIVHTVCCQEKMEEKQARIQKEMERQAMIKLKKMAKRDENMGNDSMRVNDNDQGKRKKDESVVTLQRTSLNSDLNLDEDNLDEDDTDDGDTDDDDDDDDDRYGGDGGWSRWRKEIQNDQQVNEVTASVRKGVEEQNASKRSKDRTVTGKERREQHAREDRKGQTTMEKRKREPYVSKEIEDRVRIDKERQEQHKSDNNNLRTTTAKRRSEKHRSEEDNIKTKTGMERMDQLYSEEDLSAASMRKGRKERDNKVRPVMAKGRQVKHS